MNSRAKVSSKGQIKLPDKGSVRIEPSADPGGSLHRYAVGKRRIRFKQEREQAWEAHVRDKFKLTK